MMRHWKFPLLLLLVSFCSAKAQTLSDFCHVYVIDQEVAKKALSKYPTSDPQENAKLMVTGITILGRFSPRISEEALTTKTFRLPRTNQIVTASVFYTDEMMFSSKLKTHDSMLIGVAVSKKALADAFSASHSSTAEITYAEHTDTVRVKTDVRVSSRHLLVGMECRVQRESDEADPKRERKDR